MRPAFSLHRTVSLVTGAARGIGFATARGLADAGSMVIGADILAKPSELAVEGWLELDVASAEGWRDAMAWIEDRHGRLDCLVNNAGIIRMASIENTTLADFRQMMAVNAESVLLSMQAALPLLKSSGAARHGGSSIVNISSCAGLVGAPFSGGYAASKAAVHLLSRTAAKEFGHLGYPIRVNSVHPNAADSQMADDVREGYRRAGLGTAGGEVKEIGAPIPMGRPGLSDENVGAIIYLCSTASSYVTGTQLIVDGGAMA
nr:SDR family oxidoreductase [Sphingomonas sp. Y57]